MNADTTSIIVFLPETNRNEETYQQCRQCRQVKPITDYHRRGASYQRICKECRKTHVPSGKKRVVFLNQPENYPLLAERIQQLDSRLKAKAASYAHDPLEADDIYGAMVDEILFKSDPEDSDARILTRATWTAKAVVRRNLAYSMFVGDESEMTRANDDGEIDINIKITFSRSAEDEYTDRERMENLQVVIGQLEPKYREIIGMIAVGYTQNEIAVKLHISNQTISAAMKRIATELSGLGLSPAH